MIESFMTTAKEFRPNARQSLAFNAVRQAISKESIVASHDFVEHGSQSVASPPHVHEFLLEMADEVKPVTRVSAHKITRRRRV
jgi:hypothetical protein